MLDEVAAYLAAQSTAVPYATTLAAPPAANPNLTADQLPTDPDTAVAIYEYPGMVPEYQLDGSLQPGLVKPRLEVHVRALASGDAEALIAAIFSSLSKVVAVSLSGTYYQGIHPQTSPYVLDRDQQQRWIWAFHCQVEKAPS